MHEVFRPIGSLAGLGRGRRFMIAYSA